MANRPIGDFDRRVVHRTPDERRYGRVVKGVEWVSAPYRVSCSFPSFPVKNLVSAMRALPRDSHGPCGVGESSALCEFDINTLAG